jgi:hypothetical protein
VISNSITSVEVGADRQLVLGEDHPVGLDATELGLAELGAAGHDRAGPRDRDGLAGGHVRGAADDCGGRVAVARVDGADPQAVGVGVLDGLEDLADDEELVPSALAHTVVVDGLHLGAAEREALLERAQ